MHAGDIVGSYRVIRRIGRGGMGAVYLAEHTLIGRKAAIKTLLPKLCARPAIVHRFFNEAKAAAAVKHPGIVEIYDFGFRDDDTGYIAMEYLDGDSLGARLFRDKGVNLARALEIIRQTASALAAAHASGVIHRDLKPDNIFLAEDPEIGERVKVLDFGVAKLLDFAARDDSSADSDPRDGDQKESHRTHSGMLLGTPSYMSPEQCKAAGRVDARSDLYSLGCILFQMLCGQPPFVRDGFGEVLGAHMYEAPTPPRSLEPSIPEEVETLILQLLAKNPDDRFASATELVCAIADLAAVTGDGDSGRGHASTGLPAHQPAPSTPTGSVNARRPRHPSPMLAHANQTTLSGASSAVTHQEAPAGRDTQAPSRLRLAMFAIAGFLIVGVAGAAVMGLRSKNTPGDRPETTGSLDRPTTRAGTGAAPASAASPAPSPESSPATIAIRIESTPPGAEVYAHGDEDPVGRTPFVDQRTAQREKLTFVIKKTGFHDETTVVAGDRDTNAIIALRVKTPEPSEPLASPSPGASRDRPAASQKRPASTAAARSRPRRASSSAGSSGRKSSLENRKPEPGKPSSKPDRETLKKGGYVDPF